MQVPTTYTFEAGTDVEKARWKSAATVEGCIVGGELHAAGLRQLSWSLDGGKPPLLRASDSSCVYSR